ncbi:hypothetical protein AG4045_030607 [Apium graveolens]|uniref:Uncharacterized protein n=1 Tax=Apium graveolens TaxID=4045 RepID=A0A6L5B799_APIGR|nr:hypothetical protein AG4045_030607 [Apium graveolens]
MIGLQGNVKAFKNKDFETETSPLSKQTTGRGIYILYEDVRSCPYEDVQVLWSILVESNAPALPPIN